MSKHQPVLMMNVDGTLYPVGMTEDQVSAFRLFIAGLSKEKPINVLKKTPIINASEIAEKVRDSYAINVVN